jgi:hypothetical protein
MMKSYVHVLASYALSAANLLIPLGAYAQVEEMYGTWRLVSFTRDVLDTGERTDIFGKAPHGFLAYSRDGRFMAIIVKENRAKTTDLGKLTDADRAELFKSLIAYGGTFKVDGNRLTHNVDISWNEAWTGTPQGRAFRIEGRKLTISTDPAPSVLDGKRVTAVLVWEKIQ